MSEATAHLEVDDTLRVVVLDGSSKIAIQLDRERALQVASTLLEYAIASQAFLPVAHRSIEAS